MLFLNHINKITVDFDINFKPNIACRTLVDYLYIKVQTVLACLQNILFNDNEANVLAGMESFKTVFESRPCSVMMHCGRICCLYMT